MASYPPPSSAPIPQPAQYASPMASGHGSMGYFQPGTKVQVGSHRVVVEKYLSEGGFAHVYVVRVPTASGSTETAVLKRVAVPDKEALASMRTEVETMKKLKGHKHIVTYMDSHASALKGGGYEVFLLMEYCDGGGLIDFMNTRLKNRLTEPEILKIFSDAAEGVACMHYLKPPLLHRDLKVENILISNKAASSKLYKLCDFGSTAPPRPAAGSVAEGKLIEDDVQRHTTLQYRSPEMIDVYRRQPIDEKSDIWALGVLLYKLCYYTTPFEEQGQMAILTAKFKYPAYPRFSDRLKKLIAEMLMEDPKKRPNIYQVIADVCAMRGTPVPVKDIYALRTPSEARHNERLPSPNPNVRASESLGASRIPVEQTKQEITPMRRGRPSSPSKTPDPSLVAGRKARDPFAALDSPSFDTRSKAVDELASRFPPAEQFSILQAKRNTFNFEGPPSTEKPSLSKKVTNALADEAFGVSSSRQTPNSSTSDLDQAAPRMAKRVSLTKTNDTTRPKITSVSNPNLEKPLPSRPPTITTNPEHKTETPLKPLKPPSISDRPIWRVPTPKQESTESLAPQPRPRGTERPRPSSRFLERSSFRAPETSRPSFEGLRPPALDVPHSLHRSRSADEPTLSPTRSERHRTEAEAVRNASYKPQVDLMGGPDREMSAYEESSKSSVDYLRGRENEGALPPREGHHRRSSSMFKQLKHASLPPLPGSSRNMFGGKFGNAFKRFEAGRGDVRRSSSKEDEAEESRERPINGNIPVVQSPPPMLEEALDETEELPPEMRRELERRRLSLEEKRVADAAAAHRAGIASGVRTGGPNRASAIQNRVRNLLDESERISPVKKTAHGYGRYTQEEAPSNAPLAHQTPPTMRQPPIQSRQKPASPKPPASAPPILPRPKPTLSINRPAAPPKPVALQTVQVTKATDLRAVITDPSELDWQYDFSTRYPDMSLDMVESEISGPGTPPPRTTSLKIRDV